MRKIRSRLLLKTLVLFFLTVYLWGSFINMFYIPRYAPVCFKSFPAYYLSIKDLAKSVNYHTANFLQLIDKSMLDNDQSDNLSLIPKCLLLLFAGISLFRIRVLLKTEEPLLFDNQRYSYIAFCTFRI
jgi:DMSO reductase anchor subunit